MMIQTVLVTAALVTSAAPATRVAVLLDDGAAGQPATAAIEAKLQKLGYEVVAASVSEQMRKVVAPKDLLDNRLPEGLSVFEADAVIAGAATYGEPEAVDVVKSVQVSLTVRLIDLGTGQSEATLRAGGVGIGAGGPNLLASGAEQAVEILFSKNGLEKALEKVGQTAGAVTLVVQNIPNRNVLVELKAGLEDALAGAPVKEIYFAKGLGKLVLGGSKSDKSMVGPDIADLIAQKKGLALAVDEVANTRIVARYDRSRTVHVHALVVEPKLTRKDKKRATELGRYLATQLATFEFARASYLPGRMSRSRAVNEAKKIGAGVVVESDVLGKGKSAAMSIRIIDVKTGRPIHRGQQLIDASGDFAAADALVTALKTDLPEKLAVLEPKDNTKTRPSEATAVKAPKVAPAPERPKLAPKPEGAEDLK